MASKPKPRGTSVGSTPVSKIKPGGGSFGGGGTSGSWDKPELKKPAPIVPQPKREVVSAPRVQTIKVKPRIVRKPTVKTVSAGGYNYEVDDSDRTVRVYGQLRLQPDQPRSRSAQDNAGKPNREPKDHGGHFIAREFGGPEIPYNHFAQNARFNTSDFRKLEIEWKKELIAGRKVSVDIRAYYDKNSNRPDIISVTYNMGGKSLVRSFPNSKEGQ